MTTPDRNAAMYAGEVLGSIFGVSLPIYLPWGDKDDYTPGDYGNIQVVSPEEAERVSWMGTPVLGSFTLQGGTYDSYDNQGNIVDLKLPDFIMPYATLVDFSRAMNVTKTKVLGNSGTVKEIYGLDDWNINIRGFCIDDNDRLTHKKAREQIDALCQWRNVTDTINVSGNLFDQKGIYGICIEQFNIRAIQGKYNVIAFEMQAVSDNVIELSI